MIKGAFIFAGGSACGLIVGVACGFTAGIKLDQAVDKLLAADERKQTRRRAGQPVTTEGTPA